MELGFASSMNKCLGARVDVAVPVGPVRSGDVMTEIGHQEIPKSTSTRLGDTELEARQPKCLLLRSALKTKWPELRSPTRRDIGS